MTASSYLYRCGICGKEKVITCDGIPPSYVCPTCDNHTNPCIAMELVKEIEE